MGRWYELHGGDSVFGPTLGFSREVVGLTHIVGRYVYMTLRLKLSHSEMNALRVILCFGHTIGYDLRGTQIVLRLFC